MTASPEVTAAYGRCLLISQMDSEQIKDRMENLEIHSKASPATSNLLPPAGLCLPRIDTTSPQYTHTHNGPTGLGQEPAREGTLTVKLYQEPKVLGSWTNPASPLLLLIRFLHPQR